MVCRPIPPAPGDHFGPVPWPRRPESSCHDCPPSVVRNSAASSTPGVDHIGIAQRRLQMPHTLEFPRMLRAVVPLMRGQAACRQCIRRIVNKLIALPVRHAVGSRRWFARRSARLVPGFAAIVGALDDLPEPAARLRCVNPIRINRRSLSDGKSPSRQSADRPRVHFCRLPSDVRTNAPFRVPTSTRTKLIGGLLLFAINRKSAALRKRASRLSPTKAAADFRPPVSVRLFCSE